MNSPPSKYPYEPSLAAAVTFAVLFGISGVIHSIQLKRAKTWYWIAFFIGVNFESIGYGSRAMNASEAPNYSQVPFIIQTLLPLLAPALYAASIYMLLGRIIDSLEAGHLSIIPVGWMTKIFVFGDVFSFAFQCIGGAMLSGANDKDGVDRGQNIILVGLGIQILFFAAFIVTISVFHYRIINHPTTTSMNGRRPWRQFIMVLYATSFLILVRSIFRVAEFAEGRYGVLQTTEVYLYCLDTSLMFLCAAAFNVWFPGRIVSPITFKHEERFPLGAVSNQEDDGAFRLRR
ncbi:hypothetical protein HER10_EVM0006721 [Colletotrichum scovillei]|uniref:Rta1 domain-containing protein n=1 Tax=Colletotrichum scovillei TaxID=1209932 RepID=A0A9P7UBB8_9PEZI|nr:uncharacterized protein HER10_EVM0006721 [Colletotrichum scovillei]KAF4781066.1 hypothetical protein HER10_EVM0006721 [Colletotrichum scovillei]KAG7041322.1 rta1 domain-containing protein [Colletotrichum scovillei]